MLGVMGLALPRHKWALWGELGSGGGWIVNDDLGKFEPGSSHTLFLHSETIVADRSLSITPYVAVSTCPAARSRSCLPVWKDGFEIFHNARKNR